jgi:diguanylate cyclase (GGDEF)-like protein/PAS domain S-box-containing protein
MVRKVGYINILLGSFVTVALCSLCLFYVQISRADRCAELAARIQRESQNLISFLDGVRGRRETEGRSLQTTIASFEESLRNLEYCAARDGAKSTSSDALSSITEIRDLWQRVDEPLHSSSANPFQTLRSLQSRLVALAEASNRLAMALTESRKTHQGHFIYALGMLSLCLLGAVSRITGRLSTLVKVSRQQVRTIAGSVPSGLLLMSDELRILYANPSFLEIFQMQAEAIVGRSLDVILPGLSVQKWIELVSLSGTAQRNVLMKKEGEPAVRTLRATLTVIPSQDKEQARFVLVVEDLTEFKSLLSSRGEYEQRYQAVLNSATDGMVVVSKEGTITDFSSAAEEMLEYAHDEIVGKPLSLLLPAILQTVPRHGLLSSFPWAHWRFDRSPLEVELAKKDGTLVPVELRLRRASSREDSPLILSVRDVSERKHAEMLGRDRLELIEMVALNQPLETVFASLAQMIERHLPGSFCAVMLRRENRLYPVAAPSLPVEFVRAVSGIPIEPEAGSCATAALEGRLVATSDIGSDAVWSQHRDLALKHGFRTSWSVPVYSSKGVIAGTLAVYNQELREPQKAECDLLQMTSRLAAVSIEQSQLTGRLAYQAQHDALTGLPNRFTFEQSAQQAISQARRSGRLVGLLALDLDRFKNINDTLGHIVADGLLQQIAKRLLGSVRESDVVARWGGDEFVVGLFELRHAEDATLVARKILDSMKEPFDVEGHELFITFTIGVSVFPIDGTDLTTLLRNADTALYRGKNEGKNNFQCYRPEMGAIALQRLELENHLRHALEHGEMLLHYQPQFELGSGNFVGVEALLRWNHPKFGMIPPSKFIPIAEESGLIIPLGAWVLEESCRQIQAWQRCGHPGIRVAVNVSTIQFGRPDFIESVARALSKIGVDPQLLELELTETQVMRNVEESTPRIARLRALGVSISIDDFGIGYSSLSYLQNLPIDTLKIDQSFVRDITRKRSTLPLVESIVALATSLGMRATAEGVETKAQLRALRAARCHYVQGYLLGKPVTGEELVAETNGEVPGHGSHSPLIVAMLSPNVLRKNTGSEQRKPLPLPNTSQPSSQIARPKLRVM